MSVAFVYSIYYSGKDHSSTTFHSPAFIERVSTRATFPPFHPVLFPIAILVFQATNSILFSVAASFEYTKLIWGLYSHSSNDLASGNNLSRTYFANVSNVVVFFIRRKMNLKYLSP